MEYNEIDGLIPKEDNVSSPRLFQQMNTPDLGKYLIDAAKNGDVDQVRRLISNNANFTTDWLGFSALHFAAMNGHLTTCEVLLEAGFCKDIRTKVDRTPLHMAALEGHADIVDLLLKNGADIHATDFMGMTPLHWAAERGHTPVVTVLKAYGADENIQNKFELTPYGLAEFRGHREARDAMKLSGLPMNSSVGRMAAPNEELADPTAFIITDEDTIVPAAPPADEVVISTDAFLPSNTHKLSLPLPNLRSSTPNLDILETVLGPDGMEMPVEGTESPALNRFHEEGDLSPFDNVDELTLPMRESPGDSQVSSASISPMGLPHGSCNLQQQHPMTATVETPDGGVYLVNIYNGSDGGPPEIKIFDERNVVIHDKALEEDIICILRQEGHNRGKLEDTRETAGVIAVTSNNNSMYNLQDGQLEEEEVYDFDDQATIIDMLIKFGTELTDVPCLRIKDVPLMTTVEDIFNWFGELGINVTECKSFTDFLIEAPRPGIAPLELNCSYDENAHMFILTRKE